jgi:hypothetical protein
MAWRALVVLAGVLALAVIVFFGLTRTQVGRNALRERVESQFNERFRGRLAIDSLTGNLARELTTRRVHLFDAEGRLLASVDSVTARPHWMSALLNRRLSINRLTLHRPTVHLRRGPNGRWNLARAFARSQPSASDSTGDASPIRLSALDLRIEDGTVTTSNNGSTPRLVARNRLFNYADARLRNLNARLRLRGTGDGLHFDLFSARLADPAFQIDHLTARGALQDGRLQLDRFRLDTGRSLLTGSGFADRPLAQAGSLAVTVRGRPLNLSEGRRLAPTLPLRGEVQLRAEARGTLGDLAIQRLRVERGASTLSASGRVRGLPREARFRLSFDENTLTPQDVAAVAPSVDPSRLRRAGRTQFSLDLRGEAAPIPGGGAWTLSATADVEAQTEAGDVAGTVQVERAQGRSPAYEARLQASQLDPERLTGSSALRGAGRGTITAQGRLGENTPDTVSISLRDTRLRALGSGALDLDVTTQADGVLRGTARLRQEDGSLRARFRVDSTEVAPRYHLTATADGADLAPLLPTDTVTTRLNGRFTLSGSGASIASAKGDAQLQLDSSVVRYGERTQVVPAFQQQFQLDSFADSSRLRLEGDVLTATLGGTLAPSLADLGAYWLNGVQRAARRVYRKPYPGSRDSLSAPASTPRAEPSTLAAGPGRLRGRFRLKRPGALASLLPPSTPRLPNGLSSQFNLTMRPDSLRLQFRGRADSLRLGPAALDGPRLRLRASAGSADALERALRANATLSTGTLTLGGQRVPSVEVALRQQSGTSRVRLTSGPSDQPGPARLTARLTQLPDRNRLTIQDLRLATPGYAWTRSRSEPIDLYENAVVVPSLTLRNKAATGSRQRIALRGVLSSAPSDTLFLDAERVSLADLSHRLALKQPLGGMMSSELAFTGGGRAPELTGSLNVHRLSFDDRLLGHLSLSSRYAQGSDDVEVEAALRPPPGLTRPFPADSTTPGGLRPEPSNLRIGGTLQLPGAETPGALDLRLNAKRADFFFLTYIFDQKITNVRGALHGTGHVTGTFRRPNIQADLRLENGKFSIPRFQTRYAANGPVTVDSTDIRLDDLRLHDRTGGTASVNGALHLNGYEYLSFDLAASLDELRVINVADSDSLPFFGRIWGSGRLTLRGPLSGATLSSSEADIAPKSEISIPINESQADTDTGFIVFADSTGKLPDVQQRRKNIFADRPAGERRFTEGLDLDLNLVAESGTTVRLVLDPLLGDQIKAEGSGRIQLQRSGGDLRTYGSLEVSGGEYLFTAGELFFRRFRIQNGGTLRWTGPPGNPRLDLTASYRARVSTNGLPDNLAVDLPAYLPVAVLVDVTERVQTPQVQLDLTIDRDARSRSAGYEGLEAFLSRSARSTEYATSVLLTNSFLLAPTLTEQARSGDLASTRRQIAFSSVSQLVASQLNRYLSSALPNFDLSFGVQGQNTEELGFTYGLALRLLDERLIIRGEGAYQNERTARRAQGLQGEFVVEVRLSPRVSAEAFYRREGDLLGADLTNTTGVGLSYETVFGSWNALFERFFGWLGVGGDEDGDKDAPSPPASAPPAEE